MFDKRSSDAYNPVFLKSMHLTTATWWLPGILGVGFLFEFLFAWLYFAKVCDADFLFGFYAVLTGVFCIGGALSVGMFSGVSDRMVEGLDSSLGTALTPGRIVRGSIMSLLVGWGAVFVLLLPMLLLFLSKQTELPIAECLHGAFASICLSMVIFALFSMVGKIQKNGVPFLLFLFFGPGWLVGLLQFVVFLGKATPLMNAIWIFANGAFVAILLAFVYGIQKPVTQDQHGCARKMLYATWLAWFPLVIVILAIQPKSLFFTVPARNVLVCVSVAYVYLVAVCNIFAPMHQARRVRLSIRASSAFGKAAIFLTSGGVLSGLCQMAIITLAAGAMALRWAADGKDILMQVMTWGSYVFMASALLMLLRTFVHLTPAKIILICIIAGPVMGILNELLPWFDFLLPLWKSGESTFLTRVAVPYAVGLVLTAVSAWRLPRVKW